MRVLNNKTVAVIGSEGYIGRHLVYILEKECGFNVYCYDVAEKSVQKNYKKIDLANIDSLKDINLNVKCIFLISGITGTYAGFDMYEKYVQINEIGLLNLLDVIRKGKSLPRIVFPSSRLVYKGQDKPLRENDEKEAKTIYAVNKLACENILHAYNCSFGIPYSVCRICVPYGNLLGKEYSFGTIGFFIKMAQQGKPITLYGGGTIKRTFSYIYDVCRQMIYSGMNVSDTEFVFNVGGETYSLYNVALMVAKKYGVDVMSVEWPQKDLKIESGDTYFDDNRILSSMGGYPYKKLCEFISEIKL